MKQKIFKMWVFMWAVIIMVPTIFTHFALTPIAFMICWETFILWFGYSRVYPRVDWESLYDIGMAYNVVSFFGSMFAFILPCLYRLETSQSWNTWCTGFNLLWLLLSVLLSTGSYLEVKDSKTAWKWVILGLDIMLAIIFILSILKCFGIYIF